MAENMTVWFWFVQYVLPGLFLAVSAGVSSASFVVYKSIVKLTNAVELHEKQITIINAKLESVVTQPQLLETMKRVEQQLEIMMLRSKLSGKIEVN